MAFDQLLAALEREASSAADRLLDEARAEAERIGARHEREMAQRRSVAVAAAAQQQRADLERDIAAVARTARRETLVARDLWLTRVFSAVREALPPAINHESYRTLLPTRIAAALACFESTDAMVLRCPASLLPVIQPLVAGQGNIAIQGDDQVGSGFRLTNAAGVIEVDESLEARLEHSHSVLARLALKHMATAP